LADQQGRGTGLYPGHEVLMMQLWERGEQRQVDLIKMLGLDPSTVSADPADPAGLATRPSVA